VLARLYQAHLLSERVRLAAVKHMAALAVEIPDAGWLHAPAWQVLLKPAERIRLMDTQYARTTASGRAQRLR
jgi:hypothetical protein